MSGHRREIGGGWVENVSEQNGKKYYSNVTTKATQWAFPDELKKSGDEGKSVGTGEGENRLVHYINSYLISSWCFCWCTRRRTGRCTRW